MTPCALPRLQSGTLTAQCLLLRPSRTAKEVCKQSERACLQPLAVAQAVPSSAGPPAFVPRPLSAALGALGLGIRSTNMRLQDKFPQAGHIDPDSDTAITVTSALNL